jgi:hypothetical protein
MISTKRLKILRVTKEFLLDYLLVKCQIEYSLPIYGQLKDVTVHDVFWDESRHCFSYILSHEDWPEKDDGELFEEIRLNDSDTKWVLYRRVENNG